MAGVEHGRALVERERELDAIAAAVAGVAEGTGRVIVVEGPAGIGKTSLVTAAREGASAEALPMLTARGSELESGFPFGVAHQLFLEVLRDPETKAAALADAAGPAEAAFDASASFGDVSFSALHGLYWMTLNIAADGPLLLVVDDLQWSDRPSLRFLAYLAHRLEGTSIGILAGLRTTSPGTDAALVADIASDPSAVVIRPGPLSLSAVAAMVEERFGQVPDERFSAACLSATGGNPLLLGELLGALVLEGASPVASEAGAIAEVGPRAVSRTVRQRLAGLPPEAAEVAQAVAILGDGTDIAAIAALGERDVAEVAQITGVLARAEILRAGAPLGFVHGLVRDAVYEEIPLGERQLQHERAARLAHEAGAPVEVVAAQLLAAPASGEPWVADALAAAAAEATLRGASDVTIGLLTRLLAEPLEEQRRARVLLELGIAEAKATDRDDAVAHLSAAYERLEAPDLRGAAAFALSRTFMFIGRAQEAADLAAEAAAALPEELADLAKMLETIELTSLYFGARVRDAERRFAELRSLAENASGGDGVLSAASSYDWMYRGGNAEECSALAAEAIELAAATEHDSGLAWVVANVVLVAAERPEAVEYWDRALARSHRQGSMFGVLTVHLWRGFTELRHGELPAAEESLRSGIEQISLLGGATLDYAYGLLCSTLLARGQVDAAEEALHSIPRPEGVGDGALLWRMAELELLIERGRWEEAYAASLKHAELCGWRTNPAYAQTLTFQARALEGLERRDEALEVVERELAAAEAWGAPGAIGRVLRLRGELRREAGIEDLKRAIELLEASPMRLELARALAAHGAALRLARKPTEAREPLRRALELAEVCGAAALAAHVRSELHATGARPRSSALSGPDSLTPSERRVADLAAEGQTNKAIAQALFVTPKTVEVHLSNSYRKLDISGRRELAAALAA